MSKLFSRGYSLSKRDLGILLVLGGTVGLVGVLAIDVLDAGREGGIGPSQQAALAACVGIVLLGLTLIPLGRDPA
jgi:hypothetical protein